MAYISTEDVARIRNTLKTSFPNLKFGVRKSSGGLSVDVTIKAGTVDFSDLYRSDSWMGTGYAQINQYHLHNYGDHRELFEKIVDVIKTAPSRQWYDRSDAMVDYFDTAFYFHLNVGEFNKPYKLI